MSHTLSAVDTAFLSLEEIDDAALMHIGAVMVFEPGRDFAAPTVDAFCNRLEKSLPGVPRYAERLSSMHTPALARPHWEPDPAFSLSNHVRRAGLPAPGGETELCDWAADYFSHALDRRRPLWEAVLVEGLEHGRWALALKVHHALVDGVGAVGLIDAMLGRAVLDGGADGHSVDGGADGHSVDGAGERAARLPLPAPVVQATRAWVGGAGAALRALGNGADTIRSVRRLGELVLRNELIGAPATSLNVPIGQARRFEVVRARLGELAAIGRAHGGSVNDVVLAVCAGGLRELLISRGEEPPARGLRAMVPVNVRGPEHRSALGNRISSLFVDLPVAEPDAGTRLQQIVATTGAMKSGGYADGAGTLLGLASLAPPVLTRAVLARTSLSTRLFNLTITNVPGPKLPLFLGGSVLREVLPIVPLACGHAVGIAVVSYNGSIRFGLSADRDSTPDLAVLTIGIANAIEELTALGAELMPA